MKLVLSAVFVLLLLTGCTSKTEKSAVSKEEYPDMTSENKMAVPQPEQPGTVKVKNTATFHTVEIKQMKFVPEVLRLHAGDTVLWINKDITDHDITEENRKAWTSSKFSMGKSWSKVIRESANYYCSIHVVMKGKLIVE